MIEQSLVKKRSIVLYQLAYLVVWQIVCHLEMSYVVIHSLALTRPALNKTRKHSILTNLIVKNELTLLGRMEPRKVEVSCTVPSLSISACWTKYWRRMKNNKPFNHYLLSCKNQSAVELQKKGQKENKPFEKNVGKMKKE